MNILTVAKQIQEEIDKRVADLAEKETVLVQREVALNESVEKSDKKAQELSALAQELSKREKVVLDEVAKDARIATLKQLTEDLAKKREELGRKEREISEVWQTVQARESEVMKRELAVSEREKSYKEQLQKEFWEQVKKGLPQ